LLEATTGTSALRNEQVERYLDLARQQGYDAVTLSSDLAPMVGRTP
jgi:H2-forming N5,N10-methylenetetrahydromethanopterin dehydrogenase-like enzyme